MPDKNQTQLKKESTKSSANDELKIDKRLTDEILNKQTANLGSNIRILRELHGDHQSNLADALGVTTSAISNYETNYRPPSKNMLFLIAKRYNVTVSELLEGDFSNAFLERDILINDVSNLERIISTFFPIIYSDEALQHLVFKEAFELHEKIFKAVCRQDWPFVNQWIDKCNRLYREAVEDGVEEAAANLLWWPMCQSVGLAFGSKTPDININLSSKDATVGELLRARLLIDANDLEENEEFEEAREEQIYSQYLPTIIENIFKLKKTGIYDLCELADFYVAMAYKFNVIGIGRLSKAQGREIGDELLTIFGFLRNKYVNEFHKLQQSIRDDIEE